MAEGESEGQRRQRDADPFIIGLTQHALENADTERLADLIEAFLTSDDQMMPDAFVLGLARSQAEVTADDYATALHGYGIRWTIPITYTTDSSEAYVLM